MNPIHLAGLVKRAYPSFDMNSFDDRLKLQKFVYLIQEAGLNLGYDFKLYLHGPYSTMLARDGFDMPPFKECNILKFENEPSEIIFNELLTSLKDKKDNIRTMEIMASLHLFHKIYPKKSDEDLIKSVEDKSLKFKNQTNEIKICLEDIKKNIRW